MRIYQQAAERGVNWWEMRIAVSEHFHTDPHSVRGWPFIEQLDAHIALDALDEVKALSRPKLKR